MRLIITEEMRVREKMCKYAQKNGITKAAKKYHTYRNHVYRQLEKYDGTLKSLALRSRRPKYHPNKHTNQEIEIIRRSKRYYGKDGLAEVYIQAKKFGYSRSFQSMCKHIRRLGCDRNEEKKKLRNSYTKQKKTSYKKPGEKVEIDIKYVPQGCIGFDSFGKRYYQITAIDLFSKKRVLKIVDEKTVTHTSNFLEVLEKKMGFSIEVIQSDNGYEFVNNSDVSQKETMFEKKAQELGMVHIRTRPYSPWQNGTVERSHRIDSEKFYSKAYFTSLKDMNRKLEYYNTRYNNIHRKVLDFKSPNEIVSIYFTKTI